MATPTTDSAATQSTSTALVRKRTDNELMPPPPPPKRIKRPKQVLDEDTYTDALSQIIARDFFPGLLESQTQQEYLDALESKDSAWISSASRRLQNVMTPRRGHRWGRGSGSRSGSVSVELPGGQTPVGYGGDTPASISAAAPMMASSSSSVRIRSSSVTPSVAAASITTSSTEARVRLDMSMSLDAFQAKYTTEDNESFYKLLDKQNRKRAEKYAWLWSGNRLPSKMQLKQREVEERLIQTRGSLTDDGFKRDRLAIKDRDDRPAIPQTWKSKPDNELMFIPDGVEGAMETVAERAQAESRAPPKAIVYENTRAPRPAPDSNNKDDGSVPPSPSLSAVRNAIAGRRRPCDRESTIGGAGSGGETPRVNGYAFVDDETPEPEASAAAPPPAPIIKLNPADAAPNPFRIQEQRKREALHHRLVDRISQSKRSSARLGLTGKIFDGGKTPTPRFPSSPRVSGSAMTPAAQRLWGKIDSAGKKATDSPFSKLKAPTPRATPRGSKGSSSSSSSRLRGLAK